MDQRTAHVHLAIELDSDPIKGRVSAVGAEGRGFSGWMELADAIEKARRGSGLVAEGRIADGRKD